MVTVPFTPAHLNHPRDGDRTLHTCTPSHLNNSSPRCTDERTLHPDPPPSPLTLTLTATQVSDESDGCGDEPPPLELQHDMLYGCDEADDVHEPSHYSDAGAPSSQYCAPSSQSSARLSSAATTQGAPSRPASSTQRFDEGGMHSARPAASADPKGALGEGVGLVRSGKASRGGAEPRGRSAPRGGGGGGEEGRRRGRWTRRSCRSSDLRGDLRRSPTLFRRDLRARSRAARYDLCMYLAGAAFSSGKAELPSESHSGRGSSEGSTVGSSGRVFVRRGVGPESQSERRRTSPSPQSMWSHTHDA